MTTRPSADGNLSVRPNVIERIEQFQSLQAGQYWRAMKSIPQEGIDAGTVLLIQSIRWVDDAPHTIILRPHPDMIGKKINLELSTEDGRGRRSVFFVYDEHCFLLKDFLNTFEFEPDYLDELTRRPARVQLRRSKGWQLPLNTISDCGHKWRMRRKTQGIAFPLRRIDGAPCPPLPIVPTCRFPVLATSRHSSEQRYTPGCSVPVILWCSATCRSATEVLPGLVKLSSNEY
jgi:hypothetical protein